ncbi:gamma-glutamyl-gamma-aminobutyrate hydrolase family protein [Sandarakinorhabdus rubra]|uniref:gamma-glutamyl-gamma-aminobutyrate hydrolase family protein n=1 Tax=Sandarakinorhabdus rubra TaxID=2672568 RepID=UPI0013DD7638|nr:gamma-glutamyl-gamma-aminobutyrate hydrolase family protein [Sandarakinorhabdus rubra]
MRPVLGIICCTRQVGVEPAQAVMNRYVTAAMRHADCAALLVPSLPDLMAAEEVIDRLDAVLLTGSPSNLEPSRYGEAETGDPPFDPGRDAIATGLVHSVLARGKPLFGICRGLQEINVALGGTLTREAGKGLAHHAPDDVPFMAMFDHRHDVALSPGGLLARAHDATRLTVNSVHYQGIARLGEGLTVEATAPDGMVEAVSSRIGGAPLLAVQWHPEWAPDTDPNSARFFHLLGRALRGQPLVPDGPA